MTTEDIKQLRIIIFGRTGAGKSSLGNTLIGRSFFKESPSAQNGIQQCATAQVKSESGRSLKIVETPGITDTMENSTIDEFKNGLDFLAPGPNAIIIVLMPNRFTVDGDKAVNKIFDFFGDDHFLKNTVLVMNRKSEMPEEFGENQIIPDFVEKIPSNGIEKLYKGCKKRVVLVENRQEWENRREDANEVFHKIDQFEDYYDLMYFSRVHEQNKSVEKIKELEAEVKRRGKWTRCQII